jgi:hypothetical protein
MPTFHPDAVTAAEAVVDVLVHPKPLTPLAAHIAEAAVVELPAARRAVHGAEDLREGVIVHRQTAAGVPLAAPALEIG